MMPVLGSVKANPSSKIDSKAVSEPSLHQLLHTNRISAHLLVSCKAKKNKNKKI